MFGIGPTELILIALAVGILFFGSGKILDFARSFGRMSGEFKKGKMEIENELKAGEKDAAAKSEHAAHDHSDPNHTHRA